MQVTVVRTARRLYLKFELTTGTVVTNATVYLLPEQLEEAQAYAASQDADHLTEGLYEMVIGTLMEMRQTHAKRIRREEMRQIDVLPSGPRLVSSQPVPVSQQFYWKRASTVGKMACGGQSGSLNSPAERKRRQEAERKQKNESVKRDYRLTPKN